MKQNMKERERERERNNNIPWSSIELKEKKLKRGGRERRRREGSQS